MSHKKADYRFMICRPLRILIEPPRGTAEDNAPPKGAEQQPIVLAL